MTLWFFGSDEQKKQYLPGLAEGSRIGAFALTEKPGQNDIESVEARVENGRLTGTKIPVIAGDVASFAVVAAQGKSGLSAYLVDLDQDGVISLEEAGSVLTDEAIKDALAQAAEDEKE